MKLFLGILGAVFAFSVSASAQHPHKKAHGLTGLVVILDPGHGGKDPGSNRFLGKERVCEGEYVYDVALRAEKILRSRGATPFLTIRKPGGVRNNPPSKVLADDHNEVFVLDGSQVIAGPSGLRKRTAYAGKLQNQYRGRRQVWVSIHFDVLEARKDVDGVRIIYGDNLSSLALASAFAKSFGKVGRLREDGATAVTGDKRYGLRHLFVLGGENPLPTKVLIELGNFKNDRDFWRIRDPKVRQNYAEAIASALAGY